MMNRTSQRFLGLAAEVEARIARRKSFLMDAISFRVGTRFSSFFLPCSMRGLR